MNIRPIQWWEQAIVVECLARAANSRRRWSGRLRISCVTTSPNGRWRKDATRNPMMRRSLVETPWPPTTLEFVCSMFAIHQLNVAHTAKILRRHFFRSVWPRKVNFRATVLGLTFNTRARDTETSELSIIMHA